MVEHNVRVLFEGLLYLLHQSCSVHKWKHPGPHIMLALLKVYANKCMYASSCLSVSADVCTVAICGLPY